ncbi:MAG: dihydroneopterin aldolase [Bacteroidota bacterium]
MGQIALEGLEFYAYHGYYEEERQNGNKFSVDVSVDTDLTGAAETDKLSQALNYEQLYSIVKDEMEEPSKLLEHIGQRIIDRVFDEFGQVELVRVSVSKYNPPLGGTCERAKITMSEKRDTHLQKH